MSVYDIMIVQTKRAKKQDVPTYNDIILMAKNTAKVQELRIKPNWIDRLLRFSSTLLIRQVSK